MQLRSYDGLDSAPGVLRENGFIQGFRGNAGVPGVMRV